MFFTTLNGYQNRETSLYLKNNTKLKHNVVVSKYVPPQKIDGLGNQSIYRTNEINGKKYKELKHPQRNPLQQYRRQLTIDDAAKTVSKQIINQFDIPGKTITTDISSCYNCNLDNKTVFFKQEIYPNNKCVDNNLGGLGYQDLSQNIWKCISKTVNPELNVIQSASTNVIKSYSTSNREFLKKRCKTYSQNLYSNTDKKCTRDCSYNCPDQKIPQNGNINNAIGGVDQSAYIYQTGYRSINNGQINNKNNKICCNPQQVIYKNINNKCKQTDYPNLAQAKNICV
tara:strand:+ start:1897 stop:2748 length:852 start_codon:yes stop_codon:yes gene_type:complete